MKKAIGVLAAKGIISGTSSTTFSPDSEISRVEIAALIVRTLSKLDPNAASSFSDVGKNDWYYGSVGSAKRFGIMNGTSTSTFEPNVDIQKDQIVAVTARTIRNEMDYKNPMDVESYLNKYVDAGQIPDWARSDISLTTRENLVVPRGDKRFIPAESMTRGDAAVILYRMFNKIW